GAARGREDHPGDFPAALALVVAGLLAAAIVVLQFAPERIAWLVQPLGGVEPPPGWTEARLGYLTSENAVALALALGVTSICLLLRWKRLPALVLSLAAVGLLAGDLAWYGHDAIATEPRAALLEPPTVTARLTPGSRIYGMTGEADELTY